MKKNLNYNRIKICNTCGHNGTKSRAKTCDAMIESGPGTGKDYRCQGHWTETTSPEAEFQIIIQDMPEQFETMTIENIDTVAKAIATGIFPKNTNTCHNHFGSTCPYLLLCTSGGKNMKGLCRE